MSEDVDKNLIQLAVEIYGDGYQGCTGEDDWFAAYALAMKWIAGGKAYTKTIVSDAYDHITENPQ